MCRVPAAVCRRVSIRRAREEHGHRAGAAFQRPDANPGPVLWPQLGWSLGYTWCAPPPPLLTTAHCFRLTFIMTRKEQHSRHSNLCSCRTDLTQILGRCACQPPSFHESRRAAGTSITASLRNLQSSHFSRCPLALSQQLNCYLVHNTRLLDSTQADLGVQSVLDPFPYRKEITKAHTALPRPCAALPCIC